MSLRNGKKLFLILLLLVAILPMSMSTLAQEAPDPQPFSPIFKQIESSGEYDFIAQIEQTLIPRATPSNIGATEQRIDTQLTGEVILPDYAKINMQFEADTNMPPLTIEQDGTHAYLIQDGERTEIENPLDGVMTSANYTGYLHAAENVQIIENADFPDLTVYQFDINGVAFARYMMDIARQQLPADKQQQQMTPSPMLEAMTGTGELWVNEAGLPERQILDIYVPEVNERFGAQSHIVIDFNFKTAIAGIPPITAEQMGMATETAVSTTEMSADTAVLPHITDTTANWTTEAILIGLFSLVLISFFAFLLARSHRWLRIPLPVSLILLLVLTPILQPISYAYAQEVEAAMAPPTLFEALGVADEVDAVSAETNLTTEPEFQANTPLIQQQTLIDEDACGAGDVNEDTDADGLNDFVEICLGTDPYYFDTDLDGITDTVEINGFTFGTHTFYSNPHEIDSNGDGLSDAEEWPAPYGSAPAHDPDNDSIPNLWDADNDGDGILDELDMAPFSVSAYQPNFVIRTGLNNSTFDGYQYIDIQLQPKDASHLQLMTTALDWPVDTEGTLQAHDVANTDEITFHPTLKIQSNSAPNGELREAYSVTAESKNGGYLMQLPLFPVTDGGQIVAFQARVAYEPGKLNDINWSSVEMAWIAFMENNQPNSNRTDVVPIAEYIEPEFRLTGLEVTKSGTTKYAILGTPTNQTDHRELANLLSGLEATYLQAAAYDFETMLTRFTEPTTPISETWGVPVADIAVATPQYGQPRHMDEAFSGDSDSHTTIRRLLNDPANNYNQSEIASLIMMMELDLGSATLDSLNDISGNTFTFNLADISLMKSRAVNLGHYTHDGNVWGSPVAGEAINTILDSYSTLNTTLGELQTQYPELSLSDLEMVLGAFYVTWTAGQSGLISIDGVQTVPDVVDETAVNNRINLPGTTATVTYIIDTNRLALPGAGLVTINSQTYFRYRAQLYASANAIAFVSISRSLKNLYKGYKVYNLIKKGDLGFKTFKQRVDSWEKNLRWVGSYLKQIKWIQRLGAAIAAKLKLSRIGRLILAATKVARLARILTVLSFIVSLAAFGVGLYLIWSTYDKFHSPLSYEREFALNYAIVSTVLATFFFILAFAGIGVVIVALFVLLDLVTWAITAALGVPIDSIVTTALTNFFGGDYRTRSQIDSVSFEGITVDTKGDTFAVAGSTIIFADKFEGGISGYINHMDDLNKSDIYATFQARAVDSNITASTHSNVTAPYRCSIGGSYKTCRNNLSADFTFANAGRDQQIELFYNIKAETRYVKYTLGGLIEEHKTNTMDLPDDLEAKDRWSWFTLAVDIVPNSLSGLLSWTDGGLINHDNDGDGLNNSSELSPQLDTDGDGLLNINDPDSDNDGLSDYFEASTNNTLHANSLIADTDSDGLNDGVENRLETGINTVDSDIDGLNDGAEVFHWNGTAWTGGGWFVTINGTDYWTFSDPLDPDADGDGLYDASEKLNGTSPFAANIAPQFDVGAGPILYNGNDVPGVYVQNGDTVTTSLQLLNTGTSAITTTLSFCVPDALSNVNVAASGDRVPTTTQNGSCYEWDFSSNNLQLFQEFNVEMSAVATSSTVTGTISASLPYAVNGTPQPIIVDIPYYQDNTGPTVQITDPLSDTVLTSEYYVIGGLAQDETSWVDNVQVTVDTGTYSGTLTDSRWGYTWQLPDDGVVTLTAVAYDILGNASDPHSVQVTVDTLAPNLTINLAEGATISAAEAYSTTFPLSGTAVDNYAGIERVQMRYNRGNWRTIWDDQAHPLNTTWDGTWEIPVVETAQGEHTLQLRAYDAFGNIGTLSRTVFIDILPPANDLTNRAFIQEIPKHVPGNAPVQIRGVASDAGNNPLPADPAELSGDLHSITDATVWLQVDDLNENNGGANVAWLGDINGDRLGDLAVGLPGANDGTGKVIVIKGAPGGWPIPNLGELEFLHDNTPSYIGTSGAAIGAIIHPAGDVNGDGIDDMLIGDPANDRLILLMGTTTTNIFEQELNGIPSRQIELTTGAAGETLTALSTHQVAGVGDVTNDGFSDIMVSVTGSSAGAVYLLAGDETTLPAQRLDQSAAAVLTTGANGASVAGIGDVNDDFIPDFAVAMENTVYIFAGGGGWVQAGQTSLSTTDAIASFATTDSLPTIVASGDMDGDSVDDFAFTNGSTPVIVFGDSSNNFSTQTLSGFASPLSGFLAGVGDVDKDGRSDLLVGNDDGDAYLITGNDLNSVAATLAGVETAASAPLYVSGADLAGDGSSDLAVVPSAVAAGELGYDGFGGARVPFISRSYLLEAPQKQNEQTTPMTGDVTVAAAGADFTTIQAAIDSGADRVLVQPGIYAEAIALRDDVTVIGSGADRTILTFPVNSTPTVLVDADGVDNAAVMNLTLLGEDSGIGLQATNGASNIRLERALVQGMETAVSVDNSTTTLALKNNTIVDNSNGFVASNNAGVDIRNTIFAFNTGTAVQYDPGAVLQLHQYNLYYANGTDLSPNNPGGGEQFSNPLFLDFANDDFRTERFSPVVDAGTPNDLVPTGAGKVVDIGHMEQTGTGFFVDDDYCQTCLNDGLIWGVDAFSSIQDAVDAAQADIAQLRAEEFVQFTVGVNEGVYNESVVISSSVQLLGRTPDLTHINGTTGPAVTFQAAMNAGVSGFTLTGGSTEPIGILLQGGSNSIGIERNLIQNNNVGISVTQRSSGSATFNTIIGNTTGIELARGTYWNSVERYDADGDFDGYDRVLADNCFSAVQCDERGFLWLDTANNIVSGNTNGFVAVGYSVLFSDNNLLYNTIDYTNVLSSENDIIGQDPLLVAPNGYLQVGSPALDAVSPLVEVPVGGGLSADIGWHELRAAPISVFMGQPDESLATESIGVGQVEYAIVPVADSSLPVTATLPTTWELAALDNPGEKLTYWQMTYNTTTDGLYRVYSRASDSLGNTEVDVDAWYDGAFVVDSGVPGVTLTVSSPGRLPNWRLLEAEVVDYVGQSFDVEEVYFTVNGERFEGIWALEEWEADGVSPRKFYYLFQNLSGATMVNVDITAVAVDGAGNIGTASQSESIGGDNDQWFDIYPPRFITITTPTAGEFVTDTVRFSGIASDFNYDFVCPPNTFCLDEDSGTVGLELSFDGGTTWETARSWPPQSGATFDRHWQYDWQVPGGLDATTIPVRVRAWDRAGLSTTEIITVTVDTAPPRVMVAYTSDKPEGIYFDDELDASVTVTYPVAIDGSGWTSTAIHIPQANGSPTIVPYGGASSTRHFGEASTLSFHPAIIDEEMNAVLNVIGPWYGGGEFSSIKRNGVMAIEMNEWASSTELLDDDERPYRTQSLWASWDSENAYFAWQGASWGPDGTMWVYYDVNIGGTNQPVSGTALLPFAADIAFSATGPETAHRWTYNSGTDSWEIQKQLSMSESGEYTDYGHDAYTGVTEIRAGMHDNGWVPVHTLDSHRMMAFATDADGEVWTAFPTANNLDGDFDFYYEWPNVVEWRNLLQLPVAANTPAVAMEFTTVPGVQDMIGLNSTITYVAEISNIEDEAVTGVQLLLNGSEHVIYQTVSGASSYDCSLGNSCTIDLPTLAVGERVVVTITAVLSDGIFGSEQITTTAQLQAGLPIPGTDFSLTHELDMDRPTVTIDTNPGAVIGTDSQTISGSADDGTGAGIDFVEISFDGTNWQLANGTQSWTAVVNVPTTPTWIIHARATDLLGNVSDVRVIGFVADETAPTLTSTIDSLLGGSSFAQLRGTTQDPAPDNAEVATVAMQLDDANADWNEALVYDPQSGIQDWLYNWALPYEDGVTHQVRFRATDYAGNETISSWENVIVDTIAPNVVVTTHNIQVGVAANTPALIGTISDGHSVNSMTAFIYPATGAAIEENITPTGSDWSLTLAQPIGSYDIFVQATDDAGNVVTLGAFAVEVTDNVNVAPTVACADTPIDVTLPNEANVSCTVSDDGLPTPYTVLWTQTSGPGTATFADDTSETTTVNFSAEGSYVLRLTAFDGELSTFDELTVNVSAAGGTEADLSITKTDSADPIGTEEMLTYTIVVTNNGPDLATAVSVTDTLPMDVTFSSATTTAGSCREESSEVVCDLGDMANGSNVTLSIMVLPDAVGDITNSVVVTSATADPDLANNSAAETTTVTATYLCAGVPATIVGTAGDDTLDGTSGDDVIVGLDGNDMINGRGGNDIICGGEGDDTLSGGNGDDLLKGGRGTDTLHGGNGDDVLDGGRGDDILNGGRNADILRGGRGMDTLDGGNGPDELHGGQDADTIRGGSGADTMYGGNGNDLLLGQGGTDILYGRSGDDELRGGANADEIYGGRGNDILIGNGGNDQLDGGSDVDDLDGGRGTDGCINGEVLSRCEL